MRELFTYKSWADAELCAALGRADAVAHPAETHQALRILNHIHTVDRIFQAHLRGVPHGLAASNTPETPTVDQLAARMLELDAWYVDHAAQVTPAALSDAVAFTFTDGDAGRMTRQEILLHVSLHGGYHRGAAGQVLRSIGIAPPRDLFTRHLHLEQPARRG